MSRKRFKMPRKKSRKLFTKTAQKVNKKNTYSGMPMRGGIRL